jgi:two-component system, chemotaxis family, response regulator WspR
MSAALDSAARPAVVLMVDRDAASAASLRRALGGCAGISLQSCEDPARAGEAASAAGASVVCLVVDPAQGAALDDLAACTGGVAPGLPVVVLAQRAPADLRRRVFAGGAVECLVDLPEADELAVRIRALARAVHAERERDEARQNLTALKRRLEESDVDLTSGVASRRRLEEFLDGEWRRARRNGSFLSLVLLDAPGAPPARMALALKATLRRGGDLLASCGDGRFAAVLPEVGTNGASTVSRLLREAASAAAPEVKVSVGTATLRPQEAPRAGPETLLAQAQSALA